LADDQRPHLLIIDDDVEIRSMLRDWLSKEGFWIYEAGDGPSALKLIDSFKFDLLITDLCLPPPLNGIEIVKRAREYCPQLRSLFISGHEGPKSDNPRYDDFISKPFNARQFVGCVWELLRRRSL
jgi:DNA-binding response OmpR family regulator